VGILSGLSKVYESVCLAFRSETIRRADEHLKEFYASTRKPYDPTGVDLKTGIVAEHKNFVVRDVPAPSKLEKGQKPIRVIEARKCLVESLTDEE